MPTYLDIEYEITKKCNIPEVFEIAIWDHEDRIDCELQHKYKLKIHNHSWFTYNAKMSYTIAKKLVYDIIQEMKMRPHKQYEFSNLKIFLNSWRNQNHTNQELSNVLLEMYYMSYTIKSAGTVTDFRKTVTTCITDIVNECQKIEDFENVKRFVHIIKILSDDYTRSFLKSTSKYMQYKYTNVWHIGEDIMLNKKAEWITFNKKRQQFGLEPLARFPRQKDYDSLAKYDQCSSSDGSSM